MPVSDAMQKSLRYDNMTMFGTETQVREYP